MTGVWFYLPLPDRLPVPHEHVISLPAQVDAAIGVVYLSIKFGQASMPVDMDSQEIDWLARVATLGRKDLPSMLQGPSSRTIAEVFAAAPSVPEAQATSRLLGHALLAVQQVQRAYALMSDKPHRLVTRGTIPPIIPVRVAAVPPINPDDRVTTRLIDPAESRIEFVQVDGRPLDPTPHGHPLDQEGLEELTAHVGARLQHHPRLLAFGDLQQEAQVQYDRVGDYRAAVTAAASAGESLVTLVHMLLLFESGPDPETSSQHFAPSVSHYSRLTGPMKDLLGGSWQRGRGVVGDYIASVSDLRNRVVHAGYSPGRVEAKDALLHLRQLFDYVRDRLCQNQNLEQYPRAALVMCGPDFLESRGLLTGRVRRIYEELGETWHDEFGMWCRRVEAHAAGARGG